MKFSLSHEFIAFIVCSLVKTVCTEEYVGYKDVGMEYKLHTVPKKWADARIACKTEGANLAMPQNSKEAEIIKTIFNDYPISELKNAIKRDRIILGFHDLFREDEYLLENGDSIQYAYRKWNNGEPNRRKNHEDCGSLTRTGFIDDFPCDVPSIFICEREISEKLIEINEDCHTYDFAYKQSNHTRHCYKLHLDAMTWPEARSTCKAEGGQLAIIDTQEEETFLLEIINDHENLAEHVWHRACCVFIGFHDLFKEGHDVTVEGDDLSTIGFLKWKNGNPNHSRHENCGALHKNGGLIHHYCNSVAPFMCERSIDSMIDIRIKETF